MKTFLLSLIVVCASFSSAEVPQGDLANLGFYRVRASSPPLKIVNPKANAATVKAEMRKAARDGVAVLGFPELFLTGYTAEDYLLSRTLLDNSRQALLEIVAESKKFPSLISVVGMPWELPEGRLYNVGVVVHNGVILGVVPKSYLPNYSEFYERRWFDSGEGIELEYMDPLFGKIYFSTNQIFNSGKLKLAIEVCEDGWATIPPSSLHALAGANVILNLSASNELVGKAPFRRDLVKGLSSQQIGAYVYVSAGPWESSRDLVFGGHSLIAENGHLVTESQRFDFKGSEATADLDLEKISNDRLRNRTFGSQRQKLNYRQVDIGGAVPTLKKLLVKPDSRPFLGKTKKEQNERASEIFNIQVTGLIRRLLATGSKKIVIGVSGGSDSTLALLVAQEALKRMGRPASDILAVTMPGFGTSDRTKDQSLRLMKAIGATPDEISIVAAVNQHFKDIGHDPGKLDITYENSQARERTQILFDLANKFSGLVLGTGDLSELFLGWATYNGDHMSNYNVNGSVPKTLVKSVIRYVRDTIRDGDLKQVLTDVLGTAISPELLPLNADGSIAQKSEDAFGPYEVVDFYLFHNLRNHFTHGKILALAELAFAGEFAPEQLQKWFKEIERRSYTQRFKSTAQPGGPKVGSVSLSPRDTRLPDDVDANCPGLLVSK